MRAFVLPAVLCATLLSLSTDSSFASVRGKSSKLNARVAQNDPNYSVNSVPTPADVRVLNEQVIEEKTHAPAAIADPNCAPTTPSAIRMNQVPSVMNYVAVPVMVMPMAAPTLQPMVMSPMPAPGCASCGAASAGGLGPAAAAYDQAFGPGLYRSGAEMGQNHFPYYSYRRPWYFPGQPSFHRSTDYVW